jgi:hypothetical protein
MRAMNGPPTFRSSLRDSDPGSWVAAERQVNVAGMELRESVFEIASRPYPIVSNSFFSLTFSGIVLPSNWLN